LINIFGEQPCSAWLLTKGVEVEIPFEQLKVGDIVVVNAGEVIPVDGVIETGIASIDQQRLTGESQPAEKIKGDAVFATTVVLSGKLHICVEQTGMETSAAQISKVLKETSNVMY
jgi:Cu2+-exporting ATPase